jgi:hypothetical protein
MKNQTRYKPTASKFSLLRRFATSFRHIWCPNWRGTPAWKINVGCSGPWSHVVSLLYAQLTHRIEAGELDVLLTTVVRIGKALDCPLERFVPKDF